MRSTLLRFAVPAAFLLVSLASLAVVAAGRYPIGLDFEGGAHLVLEGTHGPELSRLIPDDCEVRQSEQAIALSCRDFGWSEIDALAARLTAAAPAMRILTRSAVEPAFAGWAGRPLALGICAIACLLAAALFVARHRAWLVAAAAASVVAGMIGFLLARGITFTIASYVAGVWLALPTALALVLARGDRPIERLRRSWLGWTALLVLIGMAGVFARMEADPSSILHTLVRAGGYLIVRSGPVFAIGALALFHPARDAR